MRLKPKLPPYPSSKKIKNWNEKHLNYEIETIMNKDRWSTVESNWNEKHLNYEIETPILDCSVFLAGPLKWKASQLWDWNYVIPSTDTVMMWVLKWKASQLWDWNLRIRLCVRCWYRQIEMKSISIMRLKRYDGEESGTDYIRIEMKSISIMRLKRW